MKRFRLVKGFTLFAALMAVCFVFGCSSSSSGPEPIEAYQTIEVTVSTTDAETLILNTLNGEAVGDVDGSATLTIPAGTKFMDQDGNAYEGDVNIKFTWNDPESLGTFPGESFVNAMINGVSSNISSDGWVDIEITDGDGNSLILSEYAEIEVFSAGIYQIFNIHVSYLDDNFVSGPKCTSLGTADICYTPLVTKFHKSCTIIFNIVFLSGV